MTRCMKQQQRSMLLFEQTVKSPYTLRNYREHLKRFLKFTKLKDYDSLLKPSKEDIQIMIEDYVMDLKKTVSPNSVDTMVRGVKHFYIINKIGLYWDLISKLYPEKVKASGFMPYSNDDIRSMLRVTTSKRNKAIIHFLASTGARIGVFDCILSMKHLKSMDNGSMSVLIYADDLREYLAFLTPEATDSLNDYFQQRQDDGENFTDESPVFRSKYSLGFEDAKHLKLKSVQSLIYRIIGNSDVKRVRINKNFDKQMDHAFRKRFNTILKINSEVNSNIAEKIIGHSVTHKLDNTYFKPTVEQLFNEFKKAIPELTVSKALRLEQENKLKDEKIKKLETDKDRRIDELEKDMVSIRHLLEHANSKV